jgi:hypothetical protein
VLPAVPAETTYMEIVDAPLEIIVGKRKLGGEKVRLLINARQHQLCFISFQWPQITHRYGGTWGFGYSAVHDTNIPRDEQ